MPPSADSASSRSKKALLFPSLLSAVAVASMVGAPAHAGRERIAPAGLVGLDASGAAPAQPDQPGAAPARAPGIQLDAPLWEPGVLDPTAGWPGRWQRELDRREALLRAAKGKDHRAALALLGLLATLSGELPRDELVRFVDGVREDRKRHPLVRAFAEEQRAALHEDAGELAEAEAIQRRVGRILDWQIVGPFDNANRGGHDQRFGPELEAFAAGQSFEGKLAGEAVSWQAIEAANTLGGGYLSFDEFLRPNEYVTAYAITWVEVPKAQRAVLHLGSGGAHKVWVGEALVGEGEAYRRPDPLQDAYALELEAGWNRVLVKVGCEQGAWGLFARISGEDGGPIEGLRISASPASIAAQSAGAAKTKAKAEGTGEVEIPVAAPTQHALELDPEAGPARPPLSLRRLFEDAAEGERARPADELALAEFYRWVAPFGRDDFSARDQAREADAALASPRSALHLALAEDDSARSRRALEAGVERARALLEAEGAKVEPSVRAELSQMLIELSYSNAALGLERRAEALLEEAATVAPDDALIELAQVEQLANDGFGLAALQWAETLRRRYPHSATILREQANRLFTLGRTREALALLEQHGREHAGDVSVIEQRIEAHLQLGEVDTALGLGRDLIVGTAGRPAAWRRLAVLEEAAGHYDLATAALFEAVELAPQDPELHAQLGLLQSRAGDQAGAVAALSRSLELNPQQPGLRDLLATLGAERDDVFTRYAVDLVEVAEAATEAPVPKAWAGKDAAVLHRMIATRVSESGLGERLDHRIIKVLDERGIKSQARHDFGYEPDESYVEVRRARVYRADGRVEDIGISNHYAVGSAGYRMYYDQRGVAVEFPGLRVGDVVEVAFVRRDVATRNKFDDYYGDLVPLQGVEPIAHFEYVLETPQGMAIHANHELEREGAGEGAKGEGAKGEGAKGEGRTTYRLRRDDVAGLRPESGMPGWTEIADYLHVSTYETWDEVGRWYWGLVEGQLLVDDAIRGGVEEAMAGLPKDASERERVAALYEHVIENTRYVGLEFGIHGYKPYRTTDIYNRAFGDCKDKASLLKVMLAEIGVEAHLVLVRTRDLGRIGERPASLSAFNHAIVYVPKYDLFMDGTAEHAGAFELPAGDQGASVVVIEDGKGASFRTIPYAPADDNLSDYELGVSLAADGSAKVDHRMTMVGAGASSWRAGLEAKEQRQELFGKMLARVYPGVEVRAAKFPGIEDLGEPIRVEAELAIPGLATRVGAGADAKLRWRVLGHEVQVLRGYANLQRREHPMEIGVPNRERRTITYSLPAGMRFTQVPQGRVHESPFGRFELRVEQRERAVTITSDIEFSRARVEPGEYAEFREFLAEIDAALAQAFEAA
ncbi:DUF3857 domain-containing protein [Pseudenhygromyxa sp. WMMC2535]|uniref:DUF3857 domain-containing protein n=1 Tax=Pseudenhygromyxa sp. WMMC2535 TaxID=2712867 RepID=UPI001554DC8C|nr:DUF3857 domain-containing protein [Pseudenhygromyxa sp. WMMC2535]